MATVTTASKLGDVAGPGILHVWVFSDLFELVCRPFDVAYVPIRATTQAPGVAPLEPFRHTDHFVEVQLGEGDAGRHETRLPIAWSGLQRTIDGDARIIGVAVAVAQLCTIEPLVRELRTIGRIRIRAFATGGS